MAKKRPVDMESDITRKKRLLSSIGIIALLIFVAVMISIVFSMYPDNLCSVCG